MQFFRMCLLNFIGGGHRGGNKAGDKRPRAGMS